MLSASYDEMTSPAIVSSLPAAAGWALYLDKGKAVFHYTFRNVAHYGALTY